MVWIYDCWLNIRYIIDLWWIELWLMDGIQVGGWLWWFEGIIMRLKEEEEEEEEGKGKVVISECM